MTEVIVTIHCTTHKQLADVLALGETCDVKMDISGTIADKASKKQSAPAKKVFTKLSHPSLVVRFAANMPVNVSRTDLLEPLLKMKLKPMKRRDLSFVMRDHFQGTDAAPSTYGYPHIITQWLKEGTLIEHIKTA